MERRAAVKDMALILGLALSAPTITALFGSCASSDEKIIFSDDDKILIEEIANTIIPDTDTPGAKAAGVGAFILMMINDCYEKEEQKRFIKGLKKIDKLSKKNFNKNFVQLTSDKKIEMLSKLAEDSTKYQKEDIERKSTELKDFRGKDAASANTGEEDYSENYFFPIIHELTILGYFTSQIGATQALAYVPIPGRYDACTVLKPEQKAWELK